MRLQGRYVEINYIQNSFKSIDFSREERRLKTGRLQNLVAILLRKKLLRL